MDFIFFVDFTVDVDNAHLDATHHILPVSFQVRTMEARWLATAFGLKQWQAAQAVKTTSQYFLAHTARHAKGPVSSQTLFQVTALHLYPVYCLFVSINSSINGVNYKMWLFFSVCLSEVWKQAYKKKNPDLADATV